ncbi:hypothetical protein D3C84_1049560 [compost metagenome]
MPGSWLILEMWRADVIDVLGVERRQPILFIKRRPTGIVGALKALLGRIECHRLVEIQIPNVIDRQLGVEAEAVGGIEFHRGSGP